MTAWTYEHTLPIAAPRERIFRALTNAGELERWFAEHAEVDARMGGAYRFWGRHTLGTPRAGDAGGSITAFEPGARLAFRWSLLGVPSTVTIALEDGEGGTLTSVRQELAGVVDQPRPRELVDDWWRLSLGNLFTHVTGMGEVLRPDFDDPEPEIRLALRVDAPPASVWRALTEPEALSRWMMAKDAVVELRVGGVYDLGWRYEVDGRQVTAGRLSVLEVDPGNRLVLSWPDWRGDEAVPDQTVTWLLEAEGRGTRVTLLHRGFTRSVDLSDFPFGWGEFMRGLARVAEGLAEAGPTD